MSRRIINVGSAPLAGDGETLRDALIKVNDNFEEIYVAVDNIVIPDVSNFITADDIPVIPSDISEFTNDAGYITLADVTGEITVNPTGDLQGSVFADDSTLLVDGVNGKIVGEIDTLAGSIINLDSANFVVENIFAGNQFGVNIGAGGFNNLVVLEGEVRIQNVPLKVNSNGLTFPDNTVQTTAYQITKEITHLTDILAAGTNFGNGSNIAITNNHQTEKVLITNNLAAAGRATLPNVSVYGKIVILVTSSFRETFVDTNTWNGETNSTGVLNSSVGVRVYMSLGTDGWKLMTP